MNLRKDHYWQAVCELSVSAEEGAYGSRSPSAAASAVPLHPARQRGEGGSALIWRLTVQPLKASAAGCLQCGPVVSPA